MAILFCSLLLASTIETPATATPDDRPTVIVVVGAEGTPEYGRDFAEWAGRWSAAAGRASARFVQVSGDQSAGDGGGDKERLRALLEAEAKDEARPLWLVLIGHGTFDRREAKFNLRGADLTAEELASWLKPLRRPLAVVNCTSASAPFLNRLSGENRVVVTATRSGSEIHFARFGDQLSAAVADPSADLDKDGQTSLLEAYLAAAHRTAEFYKQGGRLMTEHALLDDNGDGLGTPADWFQGVRATKSAKDGAPPDGSRAHQWHLVRSAAEEAMPPELRARRDELELKVEALRGKKVGMPEAEYYAQLEPLLIELARLYAEQPAAAQ